MKENSIFTNNSINLKQKSMSVMPKTQSQKQILNYSQVRSLANSLYSIQLETGRSRVKISGTAANWLHKNLKKLTRAIAIHEQKMKAISMNLLSSLLDALQW